MTKNESFLLEQYALARTRNGIMAMWIEPLETAFRLRDIDPTLVLTKTYVDWLDGNKIIRVATGQAVVWTAAKFAASTDKALRLSKAQNESATYWNARREAISNVVDRLAAKQGIARSMATIAVESALQGKPEFATLRSSLQRLGIEPDSEIPAHFRVVVVTEHATLEPISPDDRFP